ncbi:beta-sandwich domain-containing protein [Puia sp. P3]|uniref:beta-sandwich domain-containing protein n=1 Tax=Puia sp. P3 TaxID=3423952 RepID=UPI003D679E8D
MKKFISLLFLSILFFSAYPSPSRENPNASGEALNPSGEAPNPSGEDLNGAIKGRVLTADGQPAAAVTVVVRSNRRTTITGEDGWFVLGNLPAGDYDLEVSLSGFEPATEHVTVQSRKTTQITIRLQVSEKQLQEVVVTGGSNKFSRSSSDYAAKMPLKNIENPQVYTTITRDLLADQLLFSADDGLRNAPGLQKMWDAIGRSGDGGGYYNARGFILQSQLRNGIAGNITSRIDAVNLERIEVLKGPSATLFGSTLTSYGGLINRVTKKPYAGIGGEVAYAGGNFGLSRISADVNTPWTREKMCCFASIPPTPTKVVFRTTVSAKALYSHQACCISSTTG